jgi:anti-sigma B factor antagonist
MKVRGEAAQTALHAMPAGGRFRRRTQQYAQESDRAQRSRYARMHRHRRSFMNNPGTKGQQVNNASIQAPDFSAQAIWRDSKVIVEVEGRITIDSSPHLRLVLFRVLGRAAGEVVVIDVSKVSYVDSSGIATLLEALEAAWKRSVRLNLVGASGRVRMFAELLELDKIFDSLGSEVVFQ